jgi:uncharacterized protein (TIGR02996 family)
LCEVKVLRNLDLPSPHTKSPGVRGTAIRKTSDPCAQRAPSDQLHDAGV